MTYVEELSLRAANKGYTISYTERTKAKESSTYDSPSYNYRTEAFSDDQSEEAMARFVELKAMLKG